MAVEFVNFPSRFAGVKSGSNLKTYLVPMQSVSCSRPPPVASFRIAKTKLVKSRGGKASGGFRRNFSSKYRVRCKPLALNSKEGLKGDLEETVEQYKRYTVAFEENDANARGKAEELSTAFASAISSLESLIDSYYFAEARKSLNKNLSVGSPRVETPIENKPPTLLRIPNLPDGNRGSSIESCLWEWKYKWTVHYEKAGSKNTDAPAVLFLPGFGVGSFHYENQLRDLGRDFRVWAIDFLGQGRSLPSEDPAPLVEGNASPEDRQYWGFGPEVEPWASELVYSVDLWRDQIQNFVDQVIGEPVYVVGNSLGGFVGLYFASCNPQLVKGITLLNATPFWAFIPNRSRSPRVAKLFPWAGNFPLPSRAKNLIDFAWRKISDPKSIENVLKQVYVDHSVVTSELLSRIVEATEHPAAAAAFSSIIFAPQGELSFNETLIRCRENNVPICLIYGREDPWVKPVWGQQVKSRVPEALYYEISPAGHCPHSEVPEVVNFLLRGWIRSVESEGSIPLPLLDDPNLVQPDQWREMEFMKMGRRRSVQARVVESASSFWYHLLSVIQSLFKNFGAKTQ